MISPEFVGAVRAGADRSGVGLTEIARTGHDVDHPVGFPEGVYLKAGFWTVGKGA